MQVTCRINKRNEKKEKEEKKACSKHESMFFCGVLLRNTMICLRNNYCGFKCSELILKMKQVYGKVLQLSFKQQLPVSTV